MNFGVPKEIRPYETRVGLTTAGVFALVQDGHKVYVENKAGQGVGFTDEDYRRVGAHICYSAEEVFGRSQVIAKVARLTQKEYKLIIEGQTILSFLHLAVASKDLGEAIHNKKVTAIAYETIQNEDGTLPVLIPTSQVVGRLAPIIAGTLLQSNYGGQGILLSGIPGVPSAEVVIIGAGVVGSNAAHAFLGLGAQVTILDKDYSKLEIIDRRLRGRVTTLLSNPYNLTRVLKFANVVVGAVLIPGKRAPIIITREMIKEMRPRAVFIDFSIDQGGCAETSRPSTHLDPTYIEDNVIHYTVPNVPARVARTASHALTNASLPYLHDIGILGVENAINENASLRRGVQLLKGDVLG